MDKIFLEKLINKGLSQRDISKQADCSHSTTKYWLKKHGLKTKNKPFNKRSTGKKITVKFAKSHQEDDGYALVTILKLGAIEQRKEL